MVELYWPRRGRFRDLERDFIADGEGVYDVDDAAEEQYRSRGWEDPDEADDEGSDEADAGDADESAEESGEFDAEAFTDRTPMDDVVDDIESGEADDHLDAVAEADDREGVQDAVEARRDELDSEGE